MEERRISEKMDVENVKKWVDTNNSSEECIEFLTQTITFCLNAYSLITNYIDYDDLDVNEKEVAAKMLTMVLFINHGIENGISINNLKNYKYNPKNNEFTKNES